MNSRLKYLQAVIYVIAAISFVLSCQQSPNLTGKWQEIGSKATLEFNENNTFKAVDDMGMGVSGIYSLDNDGNVRFEIYRNESLPEIINAKISLQGDELAFYYGDTGEVEKYRRVKP